ncbi:MAG: polysaccharide biosynthesis protein [Candidatus Krumholzibacteriota bacterium]|nr:polysaccharide biosynthesis protein [Candidatus Krumholzibacteriota bacterium]
MSEILGKMVKGSLLRILNLVTIVIVSFFMMPFVIRALGDRWYGLWIFAASIVGYYGFLDIGLSSAVQRFISQALGTEDDEEVKKIFNTALFLFFLAGILVLIISTIIVGVCPFFVKDSADVNIFRVVIFIIGLDVAISFPVRAYIGLLCSNLRQDVVFFLDISKVILRMGLILYFLSRGYGIMTLAAINLFVDIAQYIATVIYVSLKFKKLELKISYISRDRVKKLFGFSVFSFLAAVSDRIRFHTDNFVITAFLNLGMVTHYSIGARIAMYYSQMIQSGTSLIFPVFSKLEGQKDFEQIRNKYILMIKLTSIFSVFGGGLGIIFGKAFIFRWMGPNYVDAYPVLVILITGMLFHSIQGVSAAILLSHSYEKKYSIFVASEAFLNLVLSVILVHKYGVIGVALGTMMPLLLTSMTIIPFYACRAIDFSYSKYIKTIAISVLFGSATYLGCWFFVRNALENEYSSILTLGVSSAVIFLLLNIFVLLNREERKLFKIPL